MAHTQYSFEIFLHIDNPNTPRSLLPILSRFSFLLYFSRHNFRKCRSYHSYHSASTHKTYSVYHRSSNYLASHRL